MQKRLDPPRTRCAHAMPKYLPGKCWFAPGSGMPASFVMIPRAVLHGTLTVRTWYVFPFAEIVPQTP